VVGKKDHGDGRRGCFQCARRMLRSDGEDEIALGVDQLARKSRKAIGNAVGGAIDKGRGLAVAITERAESPHDDGRQYRFFEWDGEEKTDSCCTRLRQSGRRNDARRTYQQELPPVHPHPPVAMYCYL